MPQLQVVDLNPSPRTEATSLENTLSAFAQRNRANQVEKQETDALSDIYKKYQNEGRQLDDAIMSIQTRPGISPTARVNSVNQLLNLHKTNAMLQKETQKQQAKAQKAVADKAEEKATEERQTALLQQAGATPAQIAAYKVAPVGGQTKVIDTVVQNQTRTQVPKLFESGEVQDFDQGLTANQRVKRQDQRFTVQTPLVVENNKSLHALESEGQSIELLEQLTDSGKVGQGLHNLNINPKTGELFVPKLATPEEQLFVKTVNDFTVKAKDSFGARVTNFELDKFMQRLPTLANSEEGRKLIMRQMRLVNEANQLEKRAIQGVFDKYGVRNIDYADAENIARQQIKTRADEIKKEYFNYEELAKKEDAELISNIRKNVQEGYTALRKPDGQIKQYPNKNVQNLLDKGFKRI